jgi:DNA polymerase III epsilon subunit-like protein|tara:strand:- start:7829 stop:8410 length:582 start_codon:yes stop_codon:yes gene_type:complete
MNTDVMIDLETLDVLPSATILTIGAIKFDPFGDDVREKTCEKFYVKVDIDSCDRLGLTTSQDTIQWWSQQSEAAQNEAFSTKDRIPVHEAINKLYKFCWGAKRVWSHGAGFDIIILEHVFAKLNKKVPWSFWEVRDTRTLFDIGVDPDRPPVLAHHALEDAWNQAVGVQNVLRTLRTSTRLNGEMIRPYANQR